jgi:hypothetical protein
MPRGTSKEQSKVAPNDQLAAIKVSGTKKRPELSGRFFFESLIDLGS